MAAEELTGFLLSSKESVGYFTGLFLEGTCSLVTSKDIFFFVQILGYEEASYYLSESKRPYFLKPYKFAALWEKKSVLANLKRVGLEPESSASLLLRLQKAFPEVHFLASQMPLEVRSIKDKSEVAFIRKASGITRKIYPRIKERIRPGISEEEVSRILRGYFRGNGVQEAAFPTIAAVRQGSLFPHAVPTRKEFGSHDWMILDFGARYYGYCSDFTRVVFSGKIEKNVSRVYNALREAKEKAEESVMPGISAKAVDSAGRNVLKKQGLARYFIHGIGHGLGLSVHERPVLGPKSTDVLKEGMVITLEPAVYIPGWGGMRIEDTYLVTKDGLENLTA